MLSAYDNWKTEAPEEYVPEQTWEEVEPTFEAMIAAGFVDEDGNLIFDEEGPSEEDLEVEAMSLALYLN
jgi:hypothetical protein